MKLASFCFLLLFFSLGCAPDDQEFRTDLSSPNESLQLGFQLNRHAPEYFLQYQSDTLISYSPLGLDFSSELSFSSGLVLDSISRRDVDETIEDRLGERSSYPNQFRELIVHLAKKEHPNQQMDIIFRLFNEGLAFRYRLYGEGLPDSLLLKQEQTSFIFKQDRQAFAEYGHEGKYEQVSLNGVKEKCEIPLLTLHEQSAVAVNEAALENYARMFLQPDTLAAYALKVMINSPVWLKPPACTPWRVLQVADRPGQLLEQNYLLRALAPENRLDSTDWIRPGKAMRIVTNLFTTRDSKRVVDFIAASGLDYAEFDAGWYGKGYGIPNESDPESDASSVIQNLNLPEVIAYAREKGVGTILYVNKVALERQIDEVLPLYKKWGVAGLKFGFVDGRTQDGINNTHRWVEKAAANRMVVDIHDNYRPTGMSRTYPNLLTQEGIRGNEHMPTAMHNTLLPFTRYISGAGDYTICYLNDRLQTTPAHQLALGVIYFSPLHFIYWYGKPSDYQSIVGKEFFRHLPTTWDESRFLMGEPGEFVAMARRKGHEWYVGAITNETSRILKLPLDFLDSVSYQLSMFIDAAEADVNQVQQSVRSEDTLRLELLASGGAAMRLRKDSLHISPQSKTR